MAILLALYSVIKYVTYLVFKGPLNFNIELLFWIFNGVFFGAFKGTIFSILCDTIFCFMTTGIGYWMIEYAIIPPLVSIISWGYLKLYKDNDNKVIIFSILNISLIIISSITIFFFQLINNNFAYEGVSPKKILPIAVYCLIIFMCFFITVFLCYSLFKFKKTKNWDYIKRIYLLSLILLIIVIFRWLWGPYAYLQFSHRFFSKNIDFSKQYPLSLFGIVTKSYLTIPIASSIVIPIIKVLEKFKDYEQLENKFIT